MRPIFGRPTFRKPDELTKVQIDMVDGGLAITSPYNPAFVAALKSKIPASDRKWDGGRKVWMVSPAFGSQLQHLVESYYNQRVSLPKVTGSAQTSEMRLLDVRYIGAAKRREDGTETAYGWSAGQWSVIFPKSVLMEWFGQTNRPDEAQTLYGVLGVSQTVNAAELKTAWRRLARTWHPDVSKEPGSTEQFQAIQEAYQTLSDPNKRARYDAGLQLEAMGKAHSPLDDRVAMRSDYRAPLRCGLILAEGQARLGRFIVSKIIQWADIVNAEGQTLVTSWAAGDDQFTETWV